MDAVTLLTLDELTERVGMSVRNVRFYTSRGLVPPPIRRGRSGYYAADHVARLELVQELQSHGFTLAAIEKYVAGIPDAATPEDIALHRTMLAPWQSEPPVAADEAELDRRAGRTLSADDLAVLATLGIATPIGRGPLPGGRRAPLRGHRPARPRLPARGRAGDRGGVRRARPGHRRGALRGVQEAGVAGVQGVRRSAARRCRRCSNASSRCRWRPW